MMPGFVPGHHQAHAAEHFGDHALITHTSLCPELQAGQPPAIWGCRALAFLTDQVAEA